MDVESGPFDFQQHESTAVVKYLGVRGFYDAFALVVRRIIEEALNERKIKVQTVQARAKDAASFGKKAAQPSEDDPSRPKYHDPLKEITDMAGVRVITYFPGTVGDVDTLLQHEFEVREKANKGASLIEKDQFGYQSIHYLVSLSDQRAGLPEYQRFKGAVAEVQVRTILQHAWAEIEHDIQYKSSSVIPVEIRRRFMALAGLFEIADREFQAIQDADTRLTTEARSNVEAGELGKVEITPDALKAFLDRRLGPDGRMSEFSYDWTARMLRKLGFRTLQQVETCIRDYDHDDLSRLVAGSRQGQTTRFEYMLLAGMGENWLRSHPFAVEPWWAPRQQERLEKMRARGVKTRSYNPTSDLPDETAAGRSSAGAVGESVGSIEANARTNPNPGTAHGTSDSQYKPNDQ
ncbi:MAG: GTP pyrophosphokinase family protein [Bryobacteraceae bacterium]